MCGRYSQTADPARLKERFGADAPASAVRRHNISPGQEALVVAWDGGPAMRLMRWGLVPSWAKDPAAAAQAFNARAETAAEKPSFRDPFRRRRCLVPADGFYEWPKTRRGPERVPRRFVLKDRGLFAFAGLWDAWRGPGGRERQSFAVITTAANALVGELHDRMPVILSPEDEAVWLDPALRDPARLRALLRSCPAEEMDAYDVVPLVNFPENDGPECLQPLPRLL